MVVTTDGSVNVRVHKRTPSFFDQVSPPQGFTHWTPSNNEELISDMSDPSFYLPVESFSDNIRILSHYSFLSCHPDPHRSRWPASEYGLETQENDKSADFSFDLSFGLA